MAHPEKLTPEKMAEFCAKLVESGGNVTAACEHIEVSRVCAYRHRKEDPDFRAMWLEAEGMAIERMEDEARRRAVEGVQEPVFHKGEQCGTIKKYSDTLMIFLLKAHAPEKYKDRSETTVKGDIATALVAARKRTSDEQE